MNPKITVEFWGDLICPMCPIGYVKLKEGIALFPEKDNIELVYRSFRLRPGDAPHSVDEYLKRKHGRSTNVALILDQVEEWGASAGLTYKMTRTQAGDTMDAHRVVHFAQSKGLQLQAVEQLQTAHFAEEQDIFDRKTLVRLAGEIGLDETEVATMLAGDQFKEDVAADQEALRHIGVSGIPFFLVDQEYAVSGVQEPETFLAALQRAWANKKKATISMDAAGMSCGTDQCAF